MAAEYAGILSIRPVFLHRPPARSTHVAGQPMLTTVTHFYVTHRSPAPLGNHAPDHCILIQIA